MSLTRVVVLVLFLALGTLPATQAQSGKIVFIDVQGLSRMTKEAFLHALEIEVGDPYDVGRVRVRFKELWKLGLFDDITVESEANAEGNMALILKVKERPVLSSVSYADNPVATRTQIEDTLKERQLQLSLGKPIDMGAIFAAESAIRDLLGQRGYLQAEVDAEVREVTQTTRAVHFEISTGGKTRIRKISFSGNEVFSGRQLRSSLQITQPRKWYWPWSQKNLYHPLKWEQDVGNLRELYQNRGFLDVEIRPPVVDVHQAKQKDKAAEAVSAQEPVAPPAIDAPPEFPEDLSPKQLARLQRKWRKQAEREAKQKSKAEKKAKKKAKSWVELTVAVNEGEQYRLGEIRFEGNEKFPDQLLRAGIPLREGSVVRNNVIDAGVDGIRRLYANQGHLYATVVRRIERRENERIADIAIAVEEDKPYYVARINFAGNDATQDKVLRRESLLNEGNLFSQDKLDVTRVKINQLGFFQVPGEPVVEPIETESRVGVTVVGQEQGRNEIQVGGGYSGLDGAFFNGVYSTRNFLGRGQVLSSAIQIGGRSNRYQLSWQEPWFLSRPILFGISAFRRDVDFGASLSSESNGFGVLLGRRLGRFSQFNIGYNWEKVSSSTLLADNTIVEGDNTISSITPVFSYSTVNNPYRATRGKQLTISAQVAGGPLGGNTAYIKPTVRFTAYKRFLGTRVLALHTQAGWVGEWADGSDDSNSNINGVPRFQRFWLGGDVGLGPRVFETRTITPTRFVVLDDNGDLGQILDDPRLVPIADCPNQQCLPVELGGDRFFLVQAELVWPMNDQAEIAFFVDAGDSLFEDQSLNFDTTRVSAGVELRFHLPIFPVPLRLIYGIPIRELDTDRTNNFTFSIGRSF